MRKLLAIVFLIFLCHRVCSQTVTSIMRTVGDEAAYERSSLRNTPVFDAAEIKARNIRSCTVIQPWNWKNDPDTIVIYEFDPTGNVNREIRFRSWDKSIKDTIYWPDSERRYYERIDTTLEKQNGKTILTKYYVWAFDPLTEIVDTSYIKTITFDDKNRLIEFEMHGTQDYFKITFCGTGITHHKKYEYDEKDRIIYYRDLHWREYATLEHRRNRCLISMYDTTTNELVRKHTIRFKINNEAIPEDDGLFTLTLTRLEKSSKIFSQISHKQNGRGMPEFEYLFFYDYFAPPGFDSKNPILTKR